MANVTFKVTDNVGSTNLTEEIKKISNYGLSASKAEELTGDMIYQNYYNVGFLFKLKSVGHISQGYLDIGEAHSCIVRLLNGNYCLLDNLQKLYVYDNEFYLNHYNDTLDRSNVYQPSIRVLPFHVAQLESPYNSYNNNAYNYLPLMKVVGILYRLTEGKNYVMLEEVPRTISFYHDLTITSPQEFQPYEPITKAKITPIGKITQTLLMDFSTKGFTSGLPREIVTEFNSFDTCPVKYSFNEIKLPQFSSYEIKPIFEKDKQLNNSFEITTGDYANISYEIRKVKDFKAYVGKTVDNDFLSSFKIYAIKSNEWHSIESVAQESLDVRRIRPSVFKENTPVVFHYVGYGNPQYTSDVLPINLKQGDQAFAFNLKRTFLFGETLDFNTYLPDDSKLVYEDNTTALLSDIVDLKISYYTSLEGKNPYTIPNKVGQFTITINIQSPNIRLRTYLINNKIVKSVEKASSAELVNPYVNFEAGDILTFGTSSYLVLFREDGSVIDEVPYPEYLDYGLVTKLPFNYEDKVDKLGFKDGVYTLPFVVDGDITLNWEFIVDYENNLKLNTTSVKKKYYYNYETKPNFVLDINGLSGSVTRHINSLGKVNEIEVPLTIDNIVTTPTPTLGTLTYAVPVRYVGFYGQVLENYYNISIEPYVKKKIVSRSVDRYSKTGLEKFHLPTNQLQYLYSDNKTLEDITDLTGIKFYRDELLTEELIPEESIIYYNNQDSGTIYVKGLVNGSYRYNYYEDGVTKLEHVGSPVDFILGNKFSSIKNKLNIKATYQSGVSNIVKDYDFVNNDIVLTPTNLEIKYKGFTSDLGQTPLNYTNPTLDSVEIALNGSKTTFVNKTEGIDTTKIVLQAHYTNSEFVQTLEYSGTASSKTNFLTTSSESLSPETFVFDGSTILAINMGSEVIKAIPLDFTFLNYFTGVEAKKAFVVNVIEITEITSLSVSNIYREYELNDTFLNENDTTKLTIGFKSKDGVDRKTTVDLNSGLAGININPAKGTILNKITNSMEVMVTSASNYNVRAVYSIPVGKKTTSSTTKITNIVAVYFDTFAITSIHPRKKILRHKYILIKEFGIDGNPVTEIRNGKRVLVTGKYEAVGYLENTFDKRKNAKVILFKDYEPPIDGISNIEVTYPCYIEGNADIVNKCHFGIQFGNNNARNRLFISGNNEKPNIDWHSGQEEDYTYFEDTSYCIYGNSNNKIVGYSIVSNDRLAVLKDFSFNDTTLWFRTPLLKPAITGSGEVVSGLDNRPLYQEEFALSHSNTTIGALKPYGVSTFNGDTLFLSNEKSLMGLDIVGIVGDNQRVASSRSRYIDLDLEKYDLEKCWLWNNNEYLFLVLPDKIYLTHFKTIANKQYEWWEMNIKDIQVIYEEKDTIYLGNSLGQYYKFTNEYYDIEKIYSKRKGQATIDYNLYQNENKIFVTEEIINKLDIGKIYKFKSIPLVNDTKKRLYKKVASMSNANSGTSDFFIEREGNFIELKGLIDGEPNFDRIAEVENLIDLGKPFYFNHVQGKNAEINTSNPEIKYYTPFYLKRDDSFDNLTGYARYKVLNEKGQEVEISGKLVEADMCYPLDEEYIITEINKEEASFKILENGKVVDLVRYGKQELEVPLTGEIRQYQPVEAYFITAPFVFNDLNYFKTLWQYTLTNDTGKPSELELTYASNKIPYTKTKTLAKISVDSIGLDFKDMEFKKIDFDKNIVPRTYTVDRMLTDIKFMCFGFRSLNASPSILSSMSIVYSTSAPSYSGD